MVANRAVILQGNTVLVLHKTHSETRLLLFSQIANFPKNKSSKKEFLLTTQKKLFLSSANPHFLTTEWNMNPVFYLPTANHIFLHAVKLDKLAEEERRRKVEEERQFREEEMRELAAKLRKKRRKSSNSPPSSQPSSPQQSSMASNKSEDEADNGNRPSRYSRHWLIKPTA